MHFTPEKLWRQLYNVKKVAVQDRGGVIMSKMKYTILESWPALKEDLESFLSDTDAWIISELKTAQTAKNWKTVGNIIEVMELVHNLSHSH